MSAPASSAATSADHPSMLSDRAMFGHPRGLGLLFVVEMWERFSYYGMRGLLVLYLVNGLHWGDGNASRLYGTYTSLVWLTPLIGGYLADALIGTRRSLVVGALIIATGHFSLAFGPAALPAGAPPLEGPALYPFYFGLLCIIVGTGFFKPNVSTMVGQIYPAGDRRRDAGFTIFYMGINLGAALAPLVCGTLGEVVGWHYGFGAAGLGMVLGLLVYLWGRDKYLPGIGVRSPVSARAAEPRGVTPPLAANPVHAAIGAVIGVVVAAVSGSGWTGYLFGVMIGAALAVTILGTEGEERKRVTALFVVAFFVVFFWMAFEQAGSSMNLFADRYTESSVAGVTIPATWYQSINPIFILAFAPVFAILWNVLGRSDREPSTVLKMVLGLFLLGLGFVVLAIGARRADVCIAQVGAEAARVGGACAVASPLWLVGAYLLHTLGELCLSPVGLSYVTKVAPLRFASLLMGVWFLAAAVASKLGGELAARTEQIPTQSEFFMIPVYTSIGAGVLMLLLVPWLRRLTRSVAA